MAFRIEEQFEVEAPLDVVWAYLVDPPRVVSCLPGAELTEVVDARTYIGRVKVKVGPVSASYKGTARLEEVDESRYIMRLAGEGKEATGAGTAKLHLTGRLTALDPVHTRVEVEAEIDVAGKMAQFGRGLMEDVSRQLFKQFGGCMQATLFQAPTQPATPTAPPISPVPSQSAVAGTVSSPPVTPSPASPAQPVSVLSLVFRALWGRVRRIFGR